MWGGSNERRYNASSGLPPPHPGGIRMTKSAPCSPVKPLRPPPSRNDSFHVIHKVPVGDSPYVIAKHVQLVDKEPEKAIPLFWRAINAGDRVDSALKDMAIVMKQQNRPEEAIEAIKSLRGRCSEPAQESLDNVLLDLYKRCGRLDDQIMLLKHKLDLIYAGLAFNGKRTKTARSQGKKFQVSIEQEATRLLGNLGWAYMQQSNFVAAESVYRKALSMESDNNKVCNLGICLMKQGRLDEAKRLLQSVTPASADPRHGENNSHLKSYERAQDMLREMEDSDTRQQHPASKNVPKQQQQQQQFNWPRHNNSFCVSFLDDEEEDDFLDEETDENANSNIIQQLQQQQQESQLYAAAAAVAASSNPNSYFSEFPKNISPAPMMTTNFSPNKPPRCISRPASTARRSLSLESFDHLGTQPSGLQQQQQQQQTFVNTINPPAPMAIVPPPSPPLSAIPRPAFLPQDLICSFGDLGFLESPKPLDFSEQHERRRLRVFQDITTTANPLSR